MKLIADATVNFQQNLILNAMLTDENLQTAVR